MKSENYSAEETSRSTKSNLFFRLLFVAVFLASFFVRGFSVFAAFEARTKNFIVTAETADLAENVARCAEESRIRLAKLWLGTELQPWVTPCPIEVKCGPQMGAGGETTFTFGDQSVTDWKMSVQGTEERILDSVVPHEVSHTVLASYFLRPVPRWIDEGAATSIEADVERNNYRSMLIGFLQEHRGIPFNSMVQFTEYPSDMMPFYSQGFSVCEYLIAVGGHRRLIEFAREGVETQKWSESLKKYYGYQDLSDLQIRWTKWISDWHNSGHPVQLPQVVKIDDHPCDIDGRPIPGAFVASNAGSVNGNNGFQARPLDGVNPLNSFVAMPQSGEQDQNIVTVSFDTGVGTTVPGNMVVAAAEKTVSVPESGSLEYRGSYGHRDSSSVGESPVKISDSPRILGQSPRF